MYWYAKIWRDELLKNSGYLMLMSATMAGFGFAFWLLCAHLYSAEAIGIATSLISAASLISYVSLLGLNNTFVRFLPSSADRNGQINTGLAIVFGAGLVFSAVYLALLPVIAPELSFVSARWPLALCFVTLTALSTMNLATDSVFVAFREARYNLIVDGIVQSLVKLALPLALVGLGAFGIYLATGAGAAVAVGLSLLLMIRRFDYRPALTFNIDLVRRIRTFSGATYTAHLLNLSPILVLPIVVLGKLGPAAAGFFFIAFQLASLVNAVAFAVSQSLFAEGSQVGANLQRLAVRSAIVVTSLITPIAFGLAVTGRFFLQFFGGQYARNAASTLTLLSVAAVPVAVNAWAGSLLKVTEQLRALVVANVVYALIICGGAWAFAHKGLTWVGGAWLLGNIASSVLTIAVLLPELRRRTTRAHKYADANTGWGHRAGLRILYVTDEPLDGVTAPGIHVREVCATLHQLGAAVVLVAPARDARALPEAVPIRLIRGPRVARSLFYQPALAMHLVAELRRGRPDLVYVRQTDLMIAAALVAAVARLPLVVEVNGRAVDEKPRWRPRHWVLRRAGILQGIERFAVSRAALAVTVSDGIKDDLVQRHHLRDDSVVVIPNGVDTAMFRPESMEAARARLGLPVGPRYACFVGALQPWQQLDVILQALAVARDHVDLRLLVVGDGLERDRIKTLADAFGVADAVEFVGNVHQARVATYINAADFCLYYPVRVRGDGASPLKVYEYLACGKPVLCADTPGMRKEFGDVLWYCPPDSPSALAAASCSLLLGPEVAVQTRRVRTWLDVATSILHVLGALVDDTRSRAFNRTEDGTAVERGMGRPVGSDT
jgi:glycosyltransferase involved in cell wall biosynthesis/O-antigen/teichoic acid export membrane protein